MEEDTLSKKRSKILKQWLEDTRLQKSSALTDIKQDLSNWTDIIFKAARKNKLLTSAIIRLYLGHTQLIHKYIFDKQEPPICDIYTCPSGERITVHSLLILC